MSYKVPHCRDTNCRDTGISKAKAARQYVMISVGGLLALSLGATGTAAVENLTEEKGDRANYSSAVVTVREKQSKPTLRGLLDSVPVRPIEPRSPAAEMPLNAPVNNVPGNADTGEHGASVNAGQNSQAEETSQAVRLLLKLGERKVYVYRGDSVESVYPVAVGRAGWETPTGEFSVLHQVRDPGWTNPLTGEVMPPGADNPLGDRWIMFWTDNTNAIGFHGTPDRASVGTAASHGCIRMYNEDVRELYEIVSVGTPVIVEP